MCLFQILKALTKVFPGKQGSYLSHIEKNRNFRDISWFQIQVLSENPLL